jgi:hypothetical protein
MRRKGWWRETLPESFEKATPLAILDSLSGFQPKRHALKAHRSG